MPKQLSLSERIIIERMISKDYSFASIGRNLERSASTISREVIKYRCFVDRIPLPGENDCTHKNSCLKNSICDDVGGHVMDIVVSDVLKIVYAQIFALLMNLLNVLF